MANHASHAALPYAIKGARFSLLVPYLDADGDPTDPTTPDTEISKDDAAAADAAEEVASLKNSVALLTLTGAETDCSCVSIAGKAASGPKTTLGTLYPRVLAVVGSGTLSAGSAGGGTLGTLLAYDVTGCFIKTTGGTGGGGTGGANNQARKIVTYNTSTGAFTVVPNWETTPDNTTTYDVLLPEGVTLGMLRALNPTTAGRTLDVSSGGEAGVDSDNIGGTGKFSANLTAILGTAPTEGAAGRLAGAFTTFFNVAAPTLTTASVNQTGDSFVRIGSNGAGLTALPWNASWDAEVQSEVEDGLTAFGYTVTISGRIDAAISTRATPAQVNTEADQALADVGATTTRMGYLDKLNISGAVASSAEVTSIQNNTRCVRAVPSIVERPDSGTYVVRIELLLYDDVGNMEAPDSAPTIAVVNQAGTSRDANLDSTTMTLVSTGRYRSTYTLDTVHALEELLVEFTVVEGGATRTFVNVVQVVDTTAVDFTAADRTKLDTLHDTRLTAGRAAALDEITAGRLAELDAANIPADIDTLKTRIPGTVQPQTGDSYARLGAPAGVSISADIAAVKADAASLLSNLAALAGKFTGITLLAHWLGALAGKQAANATALTEIRASGAGSGTFDPTTDSGEAIRDNMGTAQTGDAYALAAGASGFAATKAVADAVKVWTDRLGTAMELDGAVYRFTTNALEMAPAGGGGGGGSTMATAIPSIGDTSAGSQGEALRAILNLTRGKRTVVNTGTTAAPVWKLRIYHFDNAATIWATLDIDHPVAPSSAVPA